MPREFRMRRSVVYVAAILLDDSKVIAAIKMTWNICETQLFPPFYLYPIFDSFIAIFVFINYFGNFRSRVTIYIFPKSVFVVDHSGTYFTLISFEIIDFETINKWFIARLLRNSVGFPRFFLWRPTSWMMTSLARGFR